MCSWSLTDTVGGGAQLILMLSSSHSVFFFFLSCAKPSPRSEGQEGGRVEGVWRLVTAAAAAPMGLGAGLGGGWGAFRLQHIRVGEYEAWGVGRGCRGGRCHDRRVQAVSIRAVHPTADTPAAQADGLDDRALGLSHPILGVLRLLLHYHLVHLSPGSQVWAHSQGQGGALLLVLLVPGRLVALLHGELAHRIVCNQHELQLVFLLLQALDLLLQIRLLFLQLLRLLWRETGNEVEQLSISMGRLFNLYIHTCIFD